MISLLNPKKLFIRPLTILFLLSTHHIISQDIGIEQKLKEMLISENFNIQVIKVHKEIDDIVVVEVIPPYREFPSIILLKKKGKIYDVVFEGLSPGIQDEQSNLLDWHTKSLGVDMILAFDETNSPNEFDNFRLRNIIEKTNTADNKSIIIPYQNFFHLHMKENNDKVFRAYTIDKTSYLNFAKALLPNWSEDYPTNNCLMFDTPKIAKSGFKKSNNKYLISAETKNKQKWVYTFDGVDEKNMYLVNKTITVNFLTPPAGARDYSRANKTIKIAQGKALR